MAVLAGRETTILGDLRVMIGLRSGAKADVAGITPLQLVDCRLMLEQFTALNREA